MSDALFTIRPACETDLATINTYAHQEGMDALPDVGDVYVAVNESGQIVGFIRMKLGNGAWYVNPVVVYPTWRRYGVGKALMDFAFDTRDEIRLVSRGSSMAFYEALGYTPASWDIIYEPIAHECDGCELRDECRPCPMRKVKGNDSLERSNSCR